jgi:hypothetical protein
MRCVAVMLLWVSRAPIESFFLFLRAISAAVVTHAVTAAQQLSSSAAQQLAAVRVVPLCPGRSIPSDSTAVLLLLTHVPLRCRFPPRGMSASRSLRHVLFVSRVNRRVLAESCPIFY